MNSKQLRREIEHVRSEAKHELKEMADWLGKSLDRTREDTTRASMSLEAKIDKLGDRFVEATAAQTARLEATLNRQELRQESDQIENKKLFKEHDNKFTRIYWWIAIAVGGIGTLSLVAEGINAWHNFMTTPLKGG